MHLKVYCVLDECHQSNVPFWWASRKIGDVRSVLGKRMERRRAPEGSARKEAK